MYKNAIAAIILLLLGTFAFSQEPPQPKSTIYPFAMEFDSSRSVLLTFPAPSGYERFPVNKMTRFMAWLTNLPLKPKIHPLIRYDHQIITRADSIGAVIDIGITSNNQQNADMPIQLAMEYLMVSGGLADFYFIIKSGDSLNFSSWLNGKYVRDARGNINHIKGEERPASLKEFYRYLEYVIVHNTNKSLLTNLDKTDGKEIIPGDLYIAFDKNDPDSAGFTVMILDVCFNDKGQTMLLLAHGGWPAQSYYIPRPWPVENRIWFTVDELKEYTAEYGEGAFYRYMRVLNL